MARRLNMSISEMASSRSAVVSKNKGCIWMVKRQVSRQRCVACGALIAKEAIVTRPKSCNSYNMATQTCFSTYGLMCTVDYGPMQSAG